jgi:raffinose/stachyose/melibiose transport system substrate-binding protein
MKRRIPLVATIAVCAMALAGCSTADAGTGDTGETAEGTLTITANYAEAAMQPIIDAFEEANAGVTVDYTQLAQGTDTNQAIRTQLAAGTASDIIMSLPGSSPLGIVTLSNDGFIADLSDEAWTQEIAEPYKSLVSVDDAVYSFPGGVQPIAAFYNTTKLNELGLTAPETWSELLDFCADARAQGVSAFAAGMADLVSTLLTTYALVATLNDGPTPGFNEGIATGEHTFADSKWTQALAQLQKMIDAGCYADGATGMSIDVANGLVADGTAIGTITLGAFFQALIDTLPEGTEYEVAALPATDDPTETYMPGSLTTGLSIFSEAKNPELAKKFLAFLAEPENYASFATDTVGVIPAIPSDAFEAPATLETFNEFVAAGKVTAFPNVYWPNGEIVASLQNNTQALFLGSIAPEQIVEAMDAAIMIP